MIASGFAAGTGGGGSVIKYLTKEDGRKIAPELFKGDLEITRALIDTNHRRWTYTHGVLAFHRDDNPTPQQLETIVQDFEEFMFAEKSPDTFNVAWVNHQDKGSIELHFVVPRVDLETGQDLNIAPPGYEKDWAAWVASVNHTYGFKDPFQQAPIATRNIYRETPHRKATREEINGWIEEQVTAGLIESRDHLIETLAKIGEITRVNDKFISLKTDEAEKAFRLKGAIYETGFDFKTGRSQTRPVESKRGKAEQGSGRGPDRVSGRDAGQDRPADRSRRAEIERNRTAAFNRRRDFFEKLRARSRKLQAERKADAFRFRSAGREDPHSGQKSGPEHGNTGRAVAREDTDWLADRGGDDNRDGDSVGADHPDDIMDSLQSHGEGRRGPREWKKSIWPP